MKYRVPSTIPNIVCMCAQVCMTLWTAAHQAPPSMGFSRQENWSGWPFPLSGDLPDPGIEPTSPLALCRALTMQSGKAIPSDMQTPSNFRRSITPSVFLFP